MHIFFSGIGGTAIGPLAMIAHKAGYEVSGSDKQDSQYLEYLKKKGISQITVGQTRENIEQIHAEKQIDWVVYSSAVAIENPDHPELVFARENNIRATKRDELLNKVITDNDLKMLAVAGTHGKTTTTAMAVWLFKQLVIPISYSVGAKISFGEMGEYDEKSEYFVYECDEFDRNFLAFKPDLSIITGIDYDHHDIFHTREDYVDAFKQFLSQSNRVNIWKSDITENKLNPEDSYRILEDNAAEIESIELPGLVNRKNAWQVIQAVNTLTGKDTEALIKIMNRFPGLSRRFEKISEGLYTDYAHTIPKIAGCLQMAKELSDDVTVVYEPLTNRRQHFIKEDYKELFEDVTKVYWVPSYLAREDPLEHEFTPSELINFMSNPEIAEPAGLNHELKINIQKQLDSGSLVVCLSGGGGGSLDEWLRQEFK